MTASFSVAFNGECGGCGATGCLKKKTETSGNMSYKEMKKRYPQASFARYGQAIIGCDYCSGRVTVVPQGEQCERCGGLGEYGQGVMCTDCLGTRVKLK